MPTVDEEGREALLRFAQRHSPAALAATEAGFCEARARRAKDEHSRLALQGAELARQARQALGQAEGPALFEQVKKIHGAAETAFRVYRRHAMAAERAWRDANRLAAAERRHEA